MFKIINLNESWKQPKRKKMIKTAVLLFSALSMGEAFPFNRLHYQINPDESLFGKNHNLSFINIYVWVYANFFFFTALQVMSEFKPKDVIVKVTRGDKTMIITNG